MPRYVFDIEADGLNHLTINRKGQTVPGASKVHLLVLRDIDNPEVAFVYRNNPNEDTIQQGWDKLKAADAVIGHNIIGYDLPVLRRLYGGEVQGRVVDTLVMARLLWPDRKNHPYGGNSLAALGNHLGCYKGDYDGGWDQWSQEMEEYCVQDTLVSYKLFLWIAPLAKQFTPSSKLEHRVATIVSDMEDTGVHIDVSSAEDLIQRLEIEKATAYDELHEAFPPRIETLKTVSYYTDDQGNQYRTKSSAPSAIRKTLVAGPLKTKTHPFNAGSSLQIADRLRDSYGWSAPVTEAGNPSIGEDVLKTLKFPEAKLLLKIQMCDKRLQHLTDWSTRARQGGGIIHPQINPCGCATSRATHSQPNQTAVPKVLGSARGYDGRYGWECRSLWQPREGWHMVGGDASGLELRMLGHHLARWDKGAYAREVVDGDIHTLNQKAADLPTRDDAKTFIYATLYGAGNGKIGTIVGKGSREGGKIRDRFMSKIPALEKLTAWTKQCASERSFIPLLDGRHAPVRSEHSALNVLLQGDGAIVMKVAMCALANKLQERGWYRTKCFFMLWAHDEFQLQAHPDISTEVGEMVVESIQEAGKRLRLACPLDGEYKIGTSWAETH